MQAVEVEKMLLFCRAPGLLVYGRVEVVVPAFPALFACSFGNSIGIFEFLGNLGPVVESELSYQFANGLVFLTKHMNYLRGP